MLSLHRTLSLGYLRQHPTRAVLVVLSIALGIAVLVATQALNRGLADSAPASVNPLAGLADLLIVNGQSGVPARMARALRDAHLPGVRDARPVIMRRVALAEADAKARSVWLFGLDWSDPALAGQTPAEGDNPWGVSVCRTYTPASRFEKLRLLVEPPALLSAGLADDLAKRLPDGGRRFRVRVSGKTPTLTVVGTVSFREEHLQRENVIVLDLAAASVLAFPGSRGYVDQINVTLEPGANPEEVRARLAGWVGDRALVQTVAANREFIQDVTAGLELGFALGGVVALVVGLFLVYNALSVSVAERRHDIGILRSVGATRRQITGLFVGEAAGLGLAGSLLGLPLGYGLAWVAVKPIARAISDALVPMESARIAVSPRLLGMALLAGTATAILAGLVPAVQAAEEEPAEAVRRVPRRHGLLYAALQVGAAALLIGGGLLLVTFRQLLPRHAGTFGGIAFVLVGALVLSPLLAGVVGRVVQPLFRHCLGLEGRLAADNLVRAPGRTGLVVAALAATGGLMVLVAGFLKSTERAIHDWIEEKVAADLFVTSGSSVVEGGYGLSMDDAFGRELARLPGVEAVMGARYHELPFRNRWVYLVALDVGAFDRAGRDRPLARSLGRFPRLREPGTALVSENFAALHGVSVGDRIPVRSPTGKIELEVIGTAVDYSWNRGTILVDRSWYVERFQKPQVDIYDVFLSPGARPEEVRRAIEDRWGEERALFVMTRPEVHRAVHSQLQRIYSMAYAQQVVVGMVALLGVVSALFISVLQRRRELGLLRAVGASRSAVLRSVLAEAVLMGLVGAAVGFLIGLLLEWYVLDILLIDDSGFRFPVRIPWLEAGVVSALAVLTATLAGLWPAYHATRLRIPEAIAYE